MLNALGSISGVSIDAEYLKIIQELRRLGLEPTGNKGADAQRLAEAKTELIEKIHKKEESKSVQSLGVQIISSVDESYVAEKSELETQRLGAMTVAELNRIYFGI